MVDNIQLPNIYKDFKHLFTNDGHFILDKFPDNVTAICIKSKAQCNNEDFYIGGDLGFIEESDNNIVRSNINGLHLVDPLSCGTSLIGSILQPLYKNLHTILWDVYRSGVDKIFDCDNLKLRNLIITSPNGIDNPFVFIEKIPFLENILFDIYWYYDSFNSDNEFLSSFAKALNANKHIRSIVFKWEISSKDLILFSAPTGWKRYTFESKYHDLHICYEKEK